MGKTKTPAETQEFLSDLGLKGKGDKLIAVPPPQVQPPVHQPTSVEGITLAPPGIDPRTMPVDEIEFDPKLLDRYPTLDDKDARAAASRYVFDLYKSYLKDPPRNSLLHRKIGTFIRVTRLSRKTGGLVKERAKVSTEVGDMAQVLVAAGFTPEDLAQWAQEHKKEKS